MSRPDGGYDGGQSDERPEPIQRWEVEEHDRGAVYSSKQALLIADGEIRGSVSFETEEELKWLKRRIHDRERRRTDEELKKLSDD